MHTTNLMFQSMMETFVPSIANIPNAAWKFASCLTTVTDCNCECHIKCIFGQKEYTIRDAWKLCSCSYVNILLIPSVLCFLQPGLTGGSDDTYVRHILIRARKKGWRVVVFNSRGCANSPVTTPQVLAEGINCFSMFKHC